jgi:hypothetical protein
MIETLDVVGGRRKANTRRDTWVGPSCSLAQSSCPSTAQAGSGDRYITVGK